MTKDRIPGPFIPSGAAAPSAPDIKDLRWLADKFLLPPVCPKDECRRGKRCRGPLKVPDFASEHPFPFCLAEGFDALYEPVARLYKFRKTILDTAAKLKAEGRWPEEKS